MAVLTRRALFQSGAAAAAPGCAHRPASSTAFNARTFCESVGINIHVGQEHTPSATLFDQAVLPAFRALGLKRLRSDLPLAPNAAPNDASFQRLRQLAAAGLRSNLICSVEGDPAASVSPSQISAAFEWSGRAVDVMEGANEPHFASDDAVALRQIIARQEALFHACRRDRAMKSVMVAAPSFHDPMARYAPRMSAACDLTNIHPYPGDSYPEARGPGQLDDWMRTAARIAPDRPVIVSETGYHCAVDSEGGHRPVSEAVRAKYLPRLLLDTYCAGARQIFVYELISSFAGDSARNPESRFGVLRHDGSPTPAYFALGNLLSLFSRSTPRACRIAIHDAAANVHRPRFVTPGGGALTPIWLAIPSPADGGVAAESEIVVRSIDRAHGRLRLHRFDAAGAVRIETMEVSAKGAPITISDLLTVIEGPVAT